MANGQDEIGPWQNGLSKAAGVDVWAFSPLPTRGKQPARKQGESRVGISWRIFGDNLAGPFV